MMRVDTLFIGLVCFTSFFPWVSFGFLNFGSDIQIYSTLICIIILPLVLLLKFFRKDGYVFIKDRLFYGVLLFILGCVLTIFSILIIDGVNFDALRGVFPYLSSIIWIVFVSLIFRDYSESIAKILPVIFLIWFAVGLIQLLYDRNFLVSSLNRTVITNDRGVISLGSEPAYFAMVSLCFTVLFYFQKKKLLTLLSIVTLILLTRSSAVIFPLVLSLSIYWIGPFIRASTKNNFKFLLLMSFFIILLFLVLLMILAYDSGAFYEVNASSRIAKLLQMFATLDFSGLIMDGSFNIRLTHYAGSIYYFLSDYGVPHGVISWPDYISSFSKNSQIFWDTGLNQTTRINSGLGTILFEGGWFGIAIFYGLYLIVTAYEPSKVKRMLLFLVLVLFFMTVFSIKIPFLYTTLMLYCASKKKEFELNKHENKFPTMS